MRLIDMDDLGVKQCSPDIFSADYCNGWNGLIGILGTAPTVDAVPVIRCRECKNWKPYGSKAARKIGDPLERYGGCEIWHGGHLETDFCSYGQAPINLIPANQEERWLKTV